MIYFSFILLILSVWNLLKNNHTINLTLIFGSAAVLVISVYLSSQKYIERSYAMRNCYLKLDEIYSKAKKAEESNDFHLLGQVENEYISTLQNIENHSSYDYMCLRFSLRSDKNTTLPEFTKINFLRFLLEKLWRITIVILFFTAPFLMYLAENRLLDL